MYRLFYCIIASLILKVSWQSTSTLNNVPIIGVLVQESYSMNKYFPNEKYHSYISASYVKLVEGAGARVAPIWIGQNERYYDEMTNYINGILFPGGATWLNRTGGYASAGKFLYKFAKEKRVPIWAICLGFELLLNVAAEEQELRTDCSAKKIALPLEFTEDFRNSELFRNVPDKIVTILSKKNITYNYHRFCVSPETFCQHLSEDNWHILSLNKDVNGIEFISAIESRDYPFFGIQFHPEKNIFEWVPNKNIPHSKDAVAVSQYFANTFVEITRHNNNSFPDREMEQRNLIYNYPVTYTGILGASYEQCYMFK